MAKFVIVLQDTDEGMKIESETFLSREDEDPAESKAIDLGKTILTAITDEDE